MKHIWIGILVLFALSSCDTENDLPFELTAEGLIGKWELYQFQGNTGAEDYRTPYEPSSKTITFLSDGNLSSVGFFDCIEGEYQVEDGEITVSFDCEEEVPERGYAMSKENNDLVLSPLLPYACFEGCAYVFKKIN